jgi:hypothetical protein
MWLLRSGEDCASTPCSVAALGGRPMLCLTLCIAAVLSLVYTGVAPSDSLPHNGWAIVRWAGIATSVVATTGAVLVAMAAALIVGLVVVTLLAGARVLAER